MAAGDFEYMERAARQMAKNLDKAKGAAAKKAAKAKAAERLAGLAYQRGMTGVAAQRMIGALGPAAALGITGAQVAQAYRKMEKVKAQDDARAKRIAKESAAKSVKVPAKRSPTDVMRQTGKRREVLAGPKEKVSSMSFKEAFADARKAGKKEFTWKGNRYHTRTKEEEAARKNKTTNKGYGGNMKTKTTNKSYGSKMVKRQAGSKMVKKPKGVGCATRGYGKAMK